MVIFKRLSLKALSALQNHDGEGELGNKNNYTNVSLGLCITFTSIHRRTHSVENLLHTQDRTFDRAGYFSWGGNWDVMVEFNFCVPDKPPWREGEQLEV